MNFLSRFMIMLAVVLVGTGTVYGQKCKYSKKEIKKVGKDLEGETILNVTEPRVIFSKFSQGATAMFIKSDKGYYFGMFFVREMGAKMEILPDNPIVFKFDDDTILKLDPGQDYARRHKLPLTTFNIKPFYTITEEQIKLFADRKIKNVKIYFTSEKVKDEKSEKDELGTYFEFEVQSDRYQANCQAGARCILIN